MSYSLTTPWTLTYTYYFFSSYTQNRWKGVTLVKLDRAPLPQAAVRLQHCEQQEEELAPCRSGKRAVTAPTGQIKRIWD